MSTQKTSYDERQVLELCVNDHDKVRRLPAPPLLMFDRIPEIQLEGGQFGKGFIRAEKDVLFKEWIFFSHFEGDPVMPGVFQLDAILQLSGFFLMHSGFDGRGRALRTGKVIFREQVRPHHKLITYRIDFKKVAEKPTPIAFAEAIAEVDGKVSVEVSGIMVGLFSNLDYEYP
jgi:3-hydroxyacyl-[acyl-carrier protein] dehydratase/trans-2-decenoyl-[acyl-carrier protein] isomerase